MLQKIKSALRALLPKTAFARGVSVLVGGTAGAQLLAVLAAPLLTRLFTPEDFGLLAVFAGMLALFSVVSSLRYELAIPLPEDDIEAASVVILCMLVVTVSALICGVFVALLAMPVTKALGVPMLAKYLWLLPLGVLVVGGYNALNYWAVRTKQFGTVARTRINQSLGMLAVQLACYKLGGLALILGQIAGQGAGIVSLARAAWAAPAFRQVTWQGVWQAAVRYKRFPFFATWDGLSNTAGVELPPLLFAVLFSPAAAGLYTLANRVMSLPMSLVGNAIGQVFFANAAQANRDGKLGSLVAELHGKLANIGLPPALLLMLLGPDLFALIFGETWRQAGEFARWMAPWLYLVFVSSPLSMLFAVTEKLPQGLAFQIILLMSRIAAIGFGASQGDLMLTVMLFTSVSALCWLGFLYWVARITGNSASTMIRPTLSAVAFGLLCATPVLVIKVSEENSQHFWLYAFAISLLLIASRYWQILRKAYS